MADVDFQVGDVVQLKSGGPTMTVTDVGEDYGTKSVWCTWFTQDKSPWKKDHGTFPVLSVKLIERS